jgi:hypothetical protein
LNFEGDDEPLSEVEEEQERSNLPSWIVSNFSGSPDEFAEKIAQNVVKPIFSKKNLRYLNHEKKLPKNMGCFCRSFWKNYVKNVSLHNRSSLGLELRVRERSFVLRTGLGVTYLASPSSPHWVEPDVLVECFIILSRCN